MSCRLPLITLAILTRPDTQGYKNGSGLGAAHGEWPSPEEQTLSIPFLLQDNLKSPYDESYLFLCLVGLIIIKPYQKLFPQFLN
jgi:hypothetical protein